MELMISPPCFHLIYENSSFQPYLLIFKVRSSMIETSTFHECRAVIQDYTREQGLARVENWSSQSVDTRNLSSRDMYGNSWLLDQVKLPPNNGRSSKPRSEMKSENSHIAEDILLSPNLSLGKQTTLKSPPMHQATPTSHKPLLILPTTTSCLGLN